MSPGHPSSADYSLSTEDGFVRYKRQAHHVEFMLNYRDKDQEAALPPATRTAIALVVDRMRDAAVAAMREAIDRMQRQMLEAMPEDDEHGEVLEPQTGDWPYLPDVHVEGAKVTVSLPAFVGELSDNQPGSASDRLLMGEYFRSMIRMRVAQLWQKYDQARLELIDQLKA